MDIQRFVGAVVDGSLPADAMEVWIDRYRALAIDTYERAELFTRVSRDEVWPVLSAEIEKYSRDLLQNPSIDTRMGRISLLSICHPELVFALGYEEVRYLAPPVDDSLVSASAKGLLEETLDEMLEPGSMERRIGELFMGGTQFRTPNGLWRDLIGVVDALLPAEGPVGSGEEAMEEWLRLLVDAWSNRSNAVEGSNRLVTMPSLSLPFTSAETMLHAGTRSVLQELSSGRIALADLHWRTLEELVAELLHDLGLQVTVTKRSNDGGRDVIARGELIPGEPMLLAVEVKQMAKVGVGEVREALWANRNFPALLFATAGRFTAGVFRERSAADSQMRLILKDGDALTQWINRYARTRQP